MNLKRDDVSSPPKEEKDYLYRGHASYASIARIGSNA